MAQRATDEATGGTTDRVIGLPATLPPVRRQQTTLYRWMAATDSACIVAALLAAYQLCFGLGIPDGGFLLVENHPLLSPVRRHRPASGPAGFAPGSATP